MNTENWTKAKVIFDGAIELSADERNTFVTRACGGEEDLLKHVVELIEAHEAADKFLSSPSARPDEEPPQDEGVVPTDLAL